jgi:tetratricopeptide (TPR) repeat protein
LLQRIYIVNVDIDKQHNGDLKLAKQYIASILEDESQVDAAWAVLRNDAGELCARQLKRTRKDLVELLNSHKIHTKPPRQDERTHRELEFARRLLSRRQPSAALGILDNLAADLKEKESEPTLLYLLWLRRASALFQLDRYPQALDAARKALDSDANGAKALYFATVASILIGDVSTASQYAERAIKVAPNEPFAWAARAQLAEARSEQMPTPPQDVASSESYQLTLAEIAARAGEWSTVIAITGAQLARGNRTENVLLLRANALLIKPPIAGDFASSVEESDRLCTELLETLADDSNPLTPRTLILRAQARAHLGREADARVDIDRARELASDDLDAIGNAARLRLLAGDDDGALELLRHPKVSESPLLLAFRARVLASRGDTVAARADLDAAVRTAADATDPDEVRFASADAAIALDDVELSGNILDMVAASAREDERYLVLNARLAFRNRDKEAATASYRRAIEKTVDRKAMLITDLAIGLLGFGAPLEAVNVFEQLSIEEVPQSALKFLARAQFEVGKFAAARAVVDFVEGQGELPSWALAMAADLELRGENLDAAVVSLGQLVERVPNNTGARIEFARRLREIGRVADAASQVATLLEGPIASGIERMQVAQLLHALGRLDEARLFALRAFRDVPHDPQMHRAYFAVWMTNETEPPVVEAVGSNTFVRIREAKGEVRERTIYADAPVETLRGELTFEEARLFGLVGLRVGETIIRNTGSWMEETWVVEEILAAGLHVLHDVMSHYEERFPNEPFFIKKFNIGDGTSVSALAPLIASLSEKRSRAASVLEEYDTKASPLGVVSNLLAGSISETMSVLSTRVDPRRKLYVEWSDQPSQKKSREVAVAATRVVLTMSALYTAHRIKVFDVLVERFDLCAPRSLFDEVREEARDAEDAFEKGTSVLEGGEAGLILREQEPHSQPLLRARDHAIERLEFLNMYVKCEERPLDTISMIGSQEDRAREVLGKSSFDAMRLATHLQLPVYTDDLGLRRLASGLGGLTFSTVSLLPVLAETGIISADTRDSLLMSLILSNYSFVHATKELLGMAVSERVKLSSAELRDVFSILGSSGASLDESARIAARTIREVALATIQVNPVSVVTELVLSSMLGRWPNALVARAVSQAASEELALLPVDLESVRYACAAVAKRGET